MFCVSVVTGRASNGNGRKPLDKPLSERSSRSGHDLGDGAEDSGRLTSVSQKQDVKFSVASMCTCSDKWATFLGVIFPWLVSFMFYEGKGFAHLINWTSLTVNGCICLLVPFLVYLKALSLKDKLLKGKASNADGT